MVALMAVASASAYSQDDAVKAILKAKTYPDAESMLKQNESALTDEGKAKAYNKLMQLAMSKVSDEEKIVDNNNVQAQLGMTDKAEPYDTVGLYEAAWKVLDNALKCDEYDNKPNNKGKVSPKFHKGNQQTCWRIRNHMLTAGQYYYDKNDYASALKYYGMYVDSENASLFSDFDKAANFNGVSLGEVARVSAVYAFQLKDYDRANHYCDIAVAQEDSHKDAVDLKVYICQQGLETRADSVKALETLRKFYETEKSETVFGTLAAMIGNIEGTDKQNAFVEERLAAYPNSSTAWALKGQNLMNAKQFDEALAAFKKSSEINERAIVFTYMGFCVASKANDCQDTTQQKAMWEEALVYLEKARSLDPDRQEANWSYPLYSCYYNLYGENDSRTKELESLVK